MITQEYNFLKWDYTVDYTEQYLHEIISSRYSNAQVQQILAALSVACQAHKNQLRSDNAPFIIHPMRVALMLIVLDKSTTSKVIMAALLHDALEDTQLSYTVIEQQCGNYVAKLVQAVTRRIDVKTVQEKMEAKRENYRAAINSRHEIRAIKTFEDLDNMICWKAIPKDSVAQKKIPRWLAEAKEMSLPLAHATNKKAYTLMQQEYMYYVSRGYGERLIEF